MYAAIGEIEALKAIEGQITRIRMGIWASTLKNKGFATEAQSAQRNLYY